MSYWLLQSALISMSDFFTDVIEEGKKYVHWHVIKNIASQRDASTPAKKPGNQINQYQTTSHSFYKFRQSGLGKIWIEGNSKRISYYRTNYYLPLRIASIHTQPYDASYPIAIGLHPIRPRYHIIEHHHIAASRILPMKKYKFIRNRRNRQVHTRFCRIYTLRLSVVVASCSVICFPVEPKVPAVVS